MQTQVVILSTVLLSGAPSLDCQSGFLSLLLSLFGSHVLSLRCSPNYQSKHARRLSEFSQSTIPGLIAPVRHKYQVVLKITSIERVRYISVSMLSCQVYSCLPRSERIQLHRKWHDDPHTKVSQSIGSPWPWHRQEDGGKKTKRQRGG
ncbi:uncharacterized protein IWZ02DRAFT_451423 [Phyllosticta citriasiana]|uniref:uncharacterized protein n=1 Tax=Phyllosticta citriasiana TaxID=595635 RepID=UPI0030FD7035